MKLPRPFEIKDCALLTLALGKSAQNLRELRDRLSEVPAGSLVHHTWEAVLRPSFDDPQYRSDFALWAEHQLGDRVLAERIGALDPLDFPDVESLRANLIERVEERLAELPWVPAVPPGNEFHFLRSQIVVFETGDHVDDPPALASRIPNLGRGSVFYHFVEARRRSPEHEDDFSGWLAGQGEAAEAARRRLAGVDIVFGSLTDLRDRVARALAPLVRTTAAVGA
jgi:hypothetical protein